MGKYYFYPVGSIYATDFAYIDSRGFEHLDDIEESDSDE